MSPRIIARSCIEPRCGEVATGKGRCAAHARRLYRGSSTQQGYGADWRRSRIAYLLANPFCVCDTACCPGERGVGVEGCGSIAAVVDHIIPHKGDQALFWDSENNWQSLAKACHDRKTAREVFHGAR